MSIGRAARAARRLRIEMTGVADQMERAAAASKDVMPGAGGSASATTTGGDRRASSSSGGTGSGSTGPVALRETNWWLERLFRLQLEAVSQAKLGARTPGNSYRRASR